MRRRKFNFLLILSTLFLVHPVIILSEESDYSLEFSTQDVTVLVNETKIINLLLRGKLDERVNIQFQPEYENVVDVYPSELYIGGQTLYSNKTNIADVQLTGVHPGFVTVLSATNPNITKITDNVFVRVTVANSWPIYYVSVVVGWIYFVAWSISFYPQIYTNFKRKSVVGLNFDFIALNIVGFVMYSLFNIGLYWIPEMKAEYFQRHTKGLNPVLINDIFFSLHAVFATLVTIVQCCIYEREDQKVSLTAKSLLGIFGLITLISAILPFTNTIHWLDFLYICSYIKLSITLIKYIPQAVMNYRRKSTVGWSIGNILLDFTGGALSICQMILNAYNYDDWKSIFGDPTKFGLGLFSVLFDIFFILQHYVFYRNREDLYEEIPGNNQATSSHRLLDDTENIFETSSNGSASDSSEAGSSLGEKGNK